MVVICYAADFLFHFAFDKELSYIKLYQIW